MVDGRTAETCNVYNMIKMARTLFSMQPDTRYANYQERALFNHILASQDPDDGSVCYMVPVGRGVQHEYQGKFQSFTCCVGSAMESHALHADGLYYESKDQQSNPKLWVNLYTPSIAEWKSAGVKVEVATDLPIGQTATVKVTPQSPKKLTLAFRRPFWAGDGFSVKVNGSAFKTAAPADSYVEITRTWKTGDSVELVMPKTLRKEALAGNPNRFAVMWGPLVLAGDLGPERRGAQARTPAPEVPILVANEQPVANWLKPVPGKPGVFRTAGVGLKQEIDFAPFYQLPRKRYAVYWDMYTPTEWSKRETDYRAAEEKQKKLEAATVAFVATRSNAGRARFQPARRGQLPGTRRRPFRQSRHQMVLSRCGRRSLAPSDIDRHLQQRQPRRQCLRRPGRRQETRRTNRRTPQSRAGSPLFRCRISHPRGSSRG